MSLSVTIEGFPQNGKNLSRSVENTILNRLNGSMGELIDELRVTSPKDLGDHAMGYRLQRFTFDDSLELTGALINDVPNSLYRERGRPPGKTPPIKAVEGWARRRGLSPYLVAKKIGDEGTQRWQDNDNPLGIERDSQPGNIKVKSDSIVRRKLNEGIEKANDFEF